MRMWRKRTKRRRRENIKNDTAASWTWTRVTPEGAQTSHFIFYTYFFFGLPKSCCFMLFVTWRISLPPESFNVIMCVYKHTHSLCPIQKPMWPKNLHVMPSHICPPLPTIVGLQWKQILSFHSLMRPSIHSSIHRPVVHLSNHSLSVRLSIRFVLLMFLLTAQCSFYDDDDDDDDVEGKLVSLL